jgi:hypothetical protein
VVVCVGLGARFLGGVEDKDVYPIRGQTVLLRAPWIRFGRSVSNSKEGISTYIIPRPGGDVRTLCPFGYRGLWLTYCAAHAVYPWWHQSGGRLVRNSMAVNLTANQLTHAMYALPGTRVHALPPHARSSLALSRSAPSLSRPPSAPLTVRTSPTLAWRPSIRS